MKLSWRSVTKMRGNKKYRRPTWDEYFVRLTEMAGLRATCDRGRSGSIIVKDRRIISTGYVGAAAKCKDCDNIGHEINTVVNPDGTESKHCIRTAHAELNAIVQAARLGISTEGGTLYCKMTPCYTCAKAIINAGIVRVVAMQDYHAGKRSKEIFKESKIRFELLNPATVNYPKQ